MYPFGINFEVYIFSRIAESCIIIHTLWPKKQIIIEHYDLKEFDFINYLNILLSPTSLNLGQFLSMNINILYTPTLESFGNLKCFHIFLCIGP